MAIRRSAAELLARASSRERVVPADARSGAVFERIVVDEDRYFVKRLSFASDWVMRAVGDRVCRQYLVWQAGIMDQSPDCIDHAVAAMSLDGAGDDAVLTIVMRDVGEFWSRPGTPRCHRASTPDSSRTWPPSAPRSGTGTTRSA